MQADQTIQMIIYDNEYQQGASRGTVNAMAADTTQNWTLTLLNGDVSHTRSADNGKSDTAYRERNCASEQMQIDI